MKANMLMEEYRRLAGISAPKVTVEKVSGLETELRRLLKSNGNIRNFIQHELSEMLMIALDRTHTEDLIEAKGGNDSIAQTVSRIVSQMVMEGLDAYRAGVKDTAGKNSSFFLSKSLNRKQRRR